MMTSVNVELPLPPTLQLLSQISEFDVDPCLLADPDKCQADQPHSSVNSPSRSTSSGSIYTYDYDGPAQATGVYVTHGTVLECDSNSASSPDTEARAARELGKILNSEILMNLTTYQNQRRISKLPRIWKWCVNIRWTFKLFLPVCLVSCKCKKTSSQ
jgi:hypothetical protein